MTKAEFEALLKIENLKLLMCDVHLAEHKHEYKMFAADVITKNFDIVTEGVPAKTPAAAVQKTIARHYKKHANN